MRPCSIEGCDRPHYAKGWCMMHYLRVRKNGDAGAAAPTSAPRQRDATGEFAMTVAPYRETTVAGRRLAVHVAVAERALGRPLPPGAEVHHVDENKLNNAPTNLVICPDRAYHMLLHSRARAMEACGNPDWRRCVFCRTWDDTANLYKHAKNHAHRACYNDYQATRRVARNALPVML